ALQIVLGVGYPGAEHRVDGGLEGYGHDPAVEVAEHTLLLPPAEDVLQALVELLDAGDAVARLPLRAARAQEDAAQREQLGAWLAHVAVHGGDVSSQCASCAG